MYPDVSPFPRLMKCDVLTVLLHLIHVFVLLHTTLFRNYLKKKNEKGRSQLSKSRNKTSIMAEVAEKTLNTFVENYKLLSIRT